MIADFLFFAQLDSKDFFGILKIFFEALKSNIVAGALAPCLFYFKYLQFIQHNC